MLRRAAKPGELVLKPNQVHTFVFPFKSLRERTVEVCMYVCLSSRVHKLIMSTQFESVILELGPSPTSALQFVWNDVNKNFHARRLRDCMGYDYIYAFLFFLSSCLNSDSQEHSLCTPYPVCIFLPTKLFLCSL